MTPAGYDPGSVSPPTVKSAPIGAKVPFLKTSYISNF